MSMAQAGQRPEIRSLFFAILQRHGTTLRRVAIATGIDAGTLSRLVNNKLPYFASREYIERIVKSLDGISQQDIDDLHRAAGHIPKDVELVYLRSETMARVIRCLVRKSEKKRQEVLAELGGQINE